MSSWPSLISDVLVVCNFDSDWPRTFFTARLFLLSIVISHLYTKCSYCSYVPPWEYLGYACTCIYYISSASPEPNLLGCINIRFNAQLKLESCMCMYIASYVYVHACHQNHCVRYPAHVHGLILSNKAVTI